MDKKNKLLLHFLKILSKKNQFKQITFDKFKKDGIDSGFKDFAYNSLLHDFYNSNVNPEVKWEEFDLSPYFNTFYDKIYSIYHGTRLPDEVFTNPIDDRFGLRRRISDYVAFYDDSIHISFERKESKFLLNLINLDETDIHYYQDAQYGYGYEPDYSEDEMIHIFVNMDNECRDKIIEIVIALGDLELGENIKDNGIISSFLAEKIITLFKQFFRNKYIDQIFEEYSKATRLASCESVIQAYHDHFNVDGVSMSDSSTIEVTYDFFLDFLKKHPNIQTFSDLEDYHFIEDSSNIEDARYEYDIDYYNLNREYYTILDNMYDSIMDDEDTMERVESVKEFNNIIKSLKFQFINGAYQKDVRTGKLTTNRFLISPRNIDFDRKKVILTFIKAKFNEPSESEDYKIPFDQIADYVTIEKLHETIKKKIRKYLLEK